MGEELSRLYAARFDDSDLRFKAAMWEVLCQDWFQRWVPTDATVLDLGAGSCEFTNAIRAARRIAVDVNPDTKAFAGPGVEVHDRLITDVTEVGDGEVDVVFSSNVLEHMPDKQTVLAALREANRVLRPGGTLIVLMPNIRYLPGRYWDYFDHHTPLTHLSLAEAFELAGFGVTRSIPRFLPYTVKGRADVRMLPLLRLYLRLPVVWPLLGRQMLLIGSKT